MGASKRTPEIERQVLERLAAGESLRAICSNGFPVAESSVREWVITDAAFAAQYAHARDIGLDCRADAMIERAMTAPDAALGRLAFDADRWYLSKMAPKRYGEKLGIGQADGLEPMQAEVNINVIGVKPQ